VSRLACVVTTIQPPTGCLRRTADALPPDASFIVIGDRKGPTRASWDCPRAELITLEEQADLPHELARQLPTGHYSRKNLGYLEAIRRGAGVLWETDDDNHPLPRFRVRERRCDAAAAPDADWVNSFAYYTKELTWPRGLPLRRVRDAAPGPLPAASPRDAPIQQALADGSPDVDAAWRLILDKPVTFDRGPSLWLAPGSACPFNSQATWWWKTAWPMMYLPSTASFRMTDIWRGFVAQRCLWALGLGVVVHEAEVFQERNEHDLLRDFEDEVPGYLGNERLMKLLRGLQLEGGEPAVPGNVLACWTALVDGGFCKPSEVPLVEAWLRDVERASATTSAAPTSHDATP
jgi:hypothetical protein